MENTLHNKKASAIFFGSHASVFVTRTALELTKRGTHVVFFDAYQGVKRPTTCGTAGKIVFHLAGLGNLIKFTFRTPREKTAVIHFLSPTIAWMAPVLRLRFRKIIGIAYGSDVLRRNKKFDPLLRLGLSFVDTFVATNKNVLDVATNEFPKLKKKSQILRFGLPTFEEIDALKDQGITPTMAKDLLGLTSMKKIICLGYSASPGQRQIDLIKFFIQHPQDEFQFLVPVQYGDSEVAKKIVDLCQSIPGNQFIPITEFYDARKSALLRISTSILINHSISDAFSGSVQEVIYSGGKVLAQKNLPYKSMPGYGNALLDYENLEEMIQIIRPKKYDEWNRKTAHELKNNRAALHLLSSWDSIYDDWRIILHP